jgi:hypothetical protein
MRTPLLRHLETEDLVRLVDHALEPDELVTFEAHLATCADCGARSRLIQDWTGSLHSVLESTDAGVALPDRLVIPRRAGWRAAAVILLIASAGLAVPPLRAWIVQIGGRVWTSIRHQPSVAVAPRGAAELPRVLVRPGGTEFAIILPIDATAAVEVEVVAGDSLAVTQTAARPGHAGRLVMLPNAVRLGSKSDYLVQVPVSLRRLLLRQGDSVVRVFRPATVGDRWFVPLQPETAR